MTISSFASLTALLCVQAPLALASSSSHNGHHHSGHHLQSRAENICAASVPNIVNDTAEYWPYQTFQSFNATPPQLNITSNGEELADGLLFFGPDLLGGDGQPKELASFIMTDAGELVWASPSANDTTNFHTQVFDGKPVITYYTPDGPQSIPGLHWGRVHILDSTYTEIYTVCPKLGLSKGKGVTAECDADLHEHFITPENTMFVTAYNVTKTDMTSLGGTKDDWVTDALVVEVDIKSGDILMVWSALEHIPINQTHATVPKNGVERPFAIDLYHINSIQSWGDYILVNSRHCWSTYLINRKTGEIEWTIDGETGGDFGPLPANGTFKWQHHARIKNISETEAVLTYFNNDNNKATPGTFTTGLALKLTLPPNPKTPIKLLAEVYDVNDEMNAAAEGSMSTLYNGNYFMGYGFKAMMKEYGPDAAHGQDVRWSAQFATLGAGHSYRAFKQEWHGLPATSPSLVVSRQTVPDELSSCVNSSNTMLGYVSWNGATDVSSYSLYGGSSNHDMKLLGSIKKMGFETVFPITEYVSAVMVSAGDASSGNVRNSTVVKVDWNI